MEGEEMFQAKTRTHFGRTRILAVSTALALGLFAVFGTPMPSQAEKVVHTLDWVAYGRDAGFYAAKAKGFLKAEGIDLVIVRGKGSSETVKRLKAGEADFGTPDAGVVTISRSRGIQVKMIGAFHAKTPMTVVTVKGRGINTIKDFAGKTLADASFSSTHKVFPAFARKNGLDPEKVTWQFMSPGALGSSGLAGTVDGWGAYATNEPSQKKAAKQAGKELLIFRFADHGVDIYSNSTTTTDEKLKNNPDQVRRYMRGMYKGLAWAIANPEEATEFILKEVPVLNRDTAKAHWRIAIDHLVTPAAKKHGLGYMSDKKVAFTRDTIADAYKVKKKPAVSDLYTTEFLPKIMVK